MRITEAQLRKIIQQTINEMSPARAGQSPKRLTDQQVGSIYTSGLKSYNSSYAMMVDDIFAGVKRAAAKYGVEPFYDVEWFQLMSDHIRDGRDWNRLSPARRQEIADLVNGAAASTTYSLEHRAR